MLIVVPRIGSTFASELDDLEFPHVLIYTQTPNHLHRRFMLSVFFSFKQRPDDHDLAKQKERLVWPRSQDQQPLSSLAIYQGRLNLLSSRIKQYLETFFLLTRSSFFALILTSPRCLAFLTTKVFIATLLSHEPLI